MASGSAQLRALAAKLNTADTAVLKPQLRAGLVAASKPLISDVKAAAASRLPSRGGLNAWVAGGVFKTSVRLGARIVDVRVIHHDRDSGGGASRQFGTDRGTFRHPVFGHNDRWVSQSVDGGWFSDTLENSLPTVLPFVKAAMDSTAAAICKL